MTRDVELAGLRHVHSGKVRDLYEVELADGQPALVMVASDRVSAFDVVLPTEILDKGAILTQLSLWWFEQLADLVDNHLITAEVREYPAACQPHAAWLAGRSMLVRPLQMVPVECVARGYLAGSGLVQYEQAGAIADVTLPPWLVDGSRLPSPIFTPTTKGGPTGHDEPMTYVEVEKTVGAELAAELRRLTIAVLRRANQLAEPRGIIVADTKVEFGRDGGGRLLLADEVLTPDSSRFWPADSWQPGGAQPSFDKQLLRDYLTGTGWDRRPPAPELPEELVAAIRDRYLSAYQRLTGERWVG